MNFHSIPVMAAIGIGTAAATDALVTVFGDETAGNTDQAIIGGLEVAGAAVLGTAAIKGRSSGLGPVFALSAGMFAGLGVANLIHALD